MKNVKLKFTIIGTLIALAFAFQSPVNAQGAPSTGYRIIPGASVPFNLPLGQVGWWSSSVSSSTLGPNTAPFRLTNGVDIDATQPYFVNVKSFGAKGDGVTNDTAAIQAAGDALRDTGGIVFFPKGTYVIMRPGVHLQGTALHPYNNVVFMGTGAASIMKAGQTIGTNNGVPPLAMLYFDGQANFSMTNVGIKSMHLVGFDTSTLAGPLLLFSRTNNGFMIDSFMDTTSTEGAYWNSPTSDTNGVCIGNHASMIGGYGVSPPAGPLSAYNVNTNNALIINNYADSCALGIEAVGSGAVITGNQFSNIAQGVALTPSTAMSLESTFPGTRYLVANNTVKNAGVSISMSSISSTQGDHLITGNIFENVDAVLSLVNTAPVTFSNNQVYDTDTAGTGSSAIVDHAATSTAPLTISNNTFVAGPTGQWAYAVFIRDAVLFDVVQNNNVIGDGFAADIFATSNTSTGWNTQFINNTITPLTMANSTARYLWQSQSFNKTTFVGVDNGTILSTLQPSRITTATVPSVGTWNVGDIAINSAPTATGISQWVNTSAGTPGTFTASLATYTAGAGLTLTSGQFFIGAGQVVASMIAPNTFVQLSPSGQQTGSINVSSTTESDGGFISTIWNAAAAAAAANVNGSTMVFTGQAGGNSNGSAAGGNGGAIQMNPGGGGSGSGAQNPGNGGQFTLNSGASGSGGSGNSNSGSFVMNIPSPHGTGSFGTYAFQFNSGATSVLNINSSMQLFPGTDNTGSIGRVSTRWANVYANIFTNGNQAATNTTAMQINPNVVDGATTIGLDVNAQTTLSSGINIRFRNNGTVLATWAPTLATFSTLIKTKRDTVSGGTSPVTGDFVLAGFGGSPTTTAISGSDAALDFTITASTVSLTNPATITYTFKDGTWTTAPICMVEMRNTNDAANVAAKAEWTTSATQLIITWNALPVSTDTYSFSAQCFGVN